jgi:Tfp pilus assembly protein PilO
MNLLFKLAFITSKQLAMLALGVAGIFYISPFYDDGSNLENQIMRLRTEITQEEDKKVKTQQILGERDRLQEILSKLTEQYEDLSRKIPTELSSSEVNRVINDLIQSAKLKSLSRKPLLENNIGILDEIPFELELQGTFNNIGQFLYLVSTLERVMLVKTITINTNGKSYDKFLTLRAIVAAYKLSNEPDISKLSGGRK